MVAPTPTGLLHLRTWLDDDVDLAAFSSWCDGHQAEQLELPGFRRVRRFSRGRAAAEGAPDSLTMYDLDRLEVLQSPQMEEHRRRSPGLPEAFRGRLRAVRCEAWPVAGVPALDGMVGGGPALAHLTVDEGPDLADWFVEAGLPLLDATGASSARLLHGTQGEQVLMVELAAEPDDLDPASLPLPPHPGGGEAAPAWAVYRLDFVATPDGEARSPHRDRPPT